MDNKLVDYYFYEFMKMPFEELKELNVSSFGKEEFGGYVDAYHLMKELEAEQAL